MVGSRLTKDIITYLTKDPEWQLGPSFLQLFESEWSKKSVNDIGVQSRDNFIKIQKKTFIAILTRSQLKEENPIRVQNKVIISRRLPAAAVVQQLVDMRHFSSLKKLMGIISWIWRAAATIDRLVVCKDGTSRLLMCGGRVQTFKEDHRAVPLLPLQAWISTLLA